jgi:hypothetical protein
MPASPLFERPWIAETRSSTDIGTGAGIKFVPDPAFIARQRRAGPRELGRPDRHAGEESETNEKAKAAVNAKNELLLCFQNKCLMTLEMARPRCL